MATDYLLDEDDDLTIANGDFVSGESTGQHQSLLMRKNKGDIRQYARTGVGIDDFILDDNPGDVYQEIQRQFEADGMLIRAIDVAFNEAGDKLNTKVNSYYP